MSENRTDTANEPVDHDDSEFMDTGVLHEPKCADQACERTHPHPKESQ